MRNVCQLCSGKSDTLANALPRLPVALMLQAMADAIPTTKEGVFGYPIKWQAYDHSTMGDKFKVCAAACDSIMIHERYTYLPVWQV